jgi:hypothetical protein
MVESQRTLILTFSHPMGEGTACVVDIWFERLFDQRRLSVVPP